MQRLSSLLTVSELGQARERKKQKENSQNFPATGAHVRWSHYGNWAWGRGGDSRIVAGEWRVLSARARSREIRIPARPPRAALHVRTELVSVGQIVGCHRRLEPWPTTKKHTPSRKNNFWHQSAAGSRGCCVKRIKKQQRVTLNCRVYSSSYPQGEGG